MAAQTPQRHDPHGRPANNRVAPLGGSRLQRYISAQEQVAALRAEVDRLGPTHVQLCAVQTAEQWLRRFFAERQSHRNRALVREWLARVRRVRAAVEAAYEEQHVANVRYWAARDRADEIACAVVPHA